LRILFLSRFVERKKEEDQKEEDKGGLIYKKIIPLTKREEGEVE